MPFLSSGHDRQNRKFPFLLYMPVQNISLLLFFTFYVILYLLTVVGNTKLFGDGDGIVHRPRLQVRTCVDVKYLKICIVWLKITKKMFYSNGMVLLGFGYMKTKNTKTFSKGITKNPICKVTIFYSVSLVCERVCWGYWVCCSPAAVLIPIWSS